MASLTFMSAGVTSHVLKELETLQREGERKCRDEQASLLDSIPAPGDRDAGGLVVWWFGGLVGIW